MFDNYRVEFEKPDLKTLQETNTVVDMHFHTSYSDGSNTLSQVAARVRQLGIGIAITDHNEIRGAVEIDGYRDIFSIPGIEITAKEGSHILVYFYDIKSLKRFYHKEIEPFKGPDVMSSVNLTCEKIIKRAAAYKSLSIFAHPYSAVYTGVHNPTISKERQHTLFSLIGGVEVINAGNIGKWNLRCALLGFNLDKAITGGSDGHSLNHLGRAVSYAPCKPTRRAFLDAIKKKRNKVIGKEIDFIRKVTVNGRKLKTNLRNYPDLVEKNIRYSYTVINSKSKSFKDRFRRTFNQRLKNRSW
jgi:predicted metal-dependent phosphoesterase TrpH